MLHVFKRSHNAHITFIFGQGMLITVYAYQTSEFFLQKKKPSIIISTQETISGMNYYTCYQCQVVYNSPECLYVQNN